MTIRHRLRLIRRRLTPERRDCSQCGATFTTTRVGGRSFCSDECRRYHDWIDSEIGRRWWLRGIRDGDPQILARSWIVLPHDRPTPAPGA
jgi:hypothetical protein